MTALSKAVGAPLDRVDGHAKAAGTARFSAEHTYPGLTHAVLVHATIPRGRIRTLDTAAAEAVPGVVAVLTHRNAPAVKPPKTLSIASMVAGTKVNYLQDDEIHWDGQPIAVVVAESPAVAKEAATLVRAEYDLLPSTVDFLGAEPTAKKQSANPLSPPEHKKGDAETALAAAAVTVDHRYTTPQHTHNALEPHATTAIWDGDRLTVHDATQSIDWTRTHLAHRFGVPVRNVRVLAPFVGGGFGSKGAMWAGTVLAVLAAKATGRPVRLTLSRESIYRTVGGRTASTQRVALGAEPGGRLTSLIHTSVSRIGRTGGMPEPITSQSAHLYAADHIHLRHNIIEMDLLPNGSMRAPGEAIGTFALEAAVDELAYELDVDPLALRLRNEPDTNPMDGKKFASRLQREALTIGAERFGWHRRTHAPRSMRDGRLLVGMGVAAAYHPSRQLAANVTLRLSRDGSALLRCGMQEIGIGAATAQAQIVADALGVPFEQVRVEYGDSDLPMSPGAGGSMQTATVAASVLEAAEKLKASVGKLARRTGGDGYPDILTRAGVPYVDAAAGSDSRLGRAASMTRALAKFVNTERKFTRAATGAHFCEVHVDEDTGEVRVARWLGVFDIGTVVNAKMAASQLRGGIVMGLGMAMSEETLVDPRTGRIMNASLAEYHVPVHADVPHIEVEFLDEPDPTMPMGVRGAGEVGITGVAAAFANAVHHATGKRVRDLPVTVDKLL